MGDVTGGFWAYDQSAGMAASQATIVHQGVEYDVVVDTSHTEALDCAHLIATHVT